MKTITAKGLGAMVIATLGLLLVFGSQSHAIRDGKDYYVWRSNEALIDSVRAHRDSIIQQYASGTPDSIPLPDTLAAATTAICTVYVGQVSSELLRWTLAYKTRGASTVHDSLVKMVIRPKFDRYAPAAYNEITTAEYQVKACSTAVPYAGWWSGYGLTRRDAFLNDTAYVYITNQEGFAIDSLRVGVGTTRRR